MPGSSPYHLFVPNKQANDQPSYGIDMRLVEIAHNGLADNVSSEISTLAADVLSLQIQVNNLQTQVNLITADEVTDWTVGSAPPAGTQLRAFYGNPTLTFVSGVSTPPLTLGTPQWFNHGYTIIVGGLSPTLDPFGITVFSVDTTFANPLTSVSIFCYSIQTSVNFPLSSAAPTPFNGNAQFSFMAIGA